MNQLYRFLPPFLADTFGFQEVIDVTDGMGILDDCSDYKGRASRTDNMEEFSGSRMVTTWIRMDDVIGGTRDKILQAFRETHRSLSPAFVLLSSSPVSSMIGTDLEEAAESILDESGIRAAAVELGGHKYYDHGISETLLTLAKLLVKPREKKIPGGINLIGGNAIDWASENVRSVSEWARANGFELVSSWGSAERAENLSRAGEAEINLVTAISGLETARWMESELGIPYIAAVPFGKSWSRLVASALRNKTAPELHAQEAASKILIIGEQLMTNAIRATLNIDYGIYGVDVATPFLLDKAHGAPGDTRFKGEEAIKQLISGGGYSLVIADPEFRSIMPGGCSFIDLPHGAICYDYAGTRVPRLVGNELNKWLDIVLPGKV